ncbi:MAG: HAD-IIIA family hydrolase, partial [Thiohalospira sp.]
ADLYVNLQGDEPLIRPGDITLLIRSMADDPDAQIGTLCHPVDAREATNPNCVKVVRGANHEALYFSRSPIPYPRDPEAAHYLKHVGIYAFRRPVLAEYSRLPRPAIGQAEGLEQLRLMHAGYRLHAYEVAPTAPGVDTPRCLERVRAIAAGLPDPAEQNPLAALQLVIADVDGVLTDGGLYYDASGECLKRFHARDGLGMRMLEETGIHVALLSGRDSPTLRKRAEDLGIHLQRFGVSDKAAACHALMAEAGVDAEHTAYVGDDSIDLPAFAVCGMAFAVADAPEYVRRQATDVLESRGGDAAFRELVDAILIARDHAHVFETADGFRRTVADTSQ